MEKLFFIAIVYGVPLGTFAVAIWKKRLWPFVLGVAAFTISQMFLRIPLLQLLSTHSTSYQILAIMQPLLFYFLLALSAGLFEETARLLAMKYLLRQRTLINGLMFGLGHGTIEVLLIVGIPALQQAVWGQSLFYSAVERGLAIIMHICFSLLVLLTVKSNRYMYYVGAIFAHTIINFIGVLLVQYVVVGVVETVLAICTCILGGITYLFIRRNWNEQT